MIQVHEPIVVEIERKINVGWEASFKNNHLLADEYGAFGLDVSDPDINAHYAAYDSTVARYPLDTDRIRWATVCPPKPYDGERSFKEHVVCYWSDTCAYPSDEVLESWQAHETIFLLQSEVTPWNDWNLGFEPRFGPEEFARVRAKVHDLGMRFIVYTSLYYFLKDTALEYAAMNSFEGFVGWPPGTPTGENMPLFLFTIENLMRTHTPHGLYFDGQYIQKPGSIIRSCAKCACECGG